jgi:hypothetical protein
MAARDYANQDMTDHIVLPNDHFADLAHNGHGRAVEIFDTQFFVDYLVSHQDSPLCFLSNTRLTNYPRIGSDGNILVG